MVRAASRSPRYPAFELGLVAFAIVLAVLTWLTIVLPDVRFGVEAPTGDILINEAAVLIASAAAWLAWLRFRHINDASAVFQAASFALFAILAGAQLAATLGIGRDLLKLDLASPGQAPIYAWAWVRSIAAVLLIAGAGRRLAPQPVKRPSAVVIAAVAVAILGVVLIYAAEPVLPQALGIQAINELRSPETVTGFLEDASLIEVALQVACAALFAIGALLYARAARRADSPGDRYLAVGLILAAFAQIHFALFPGAYAGIVSTSDLLRVAFYACVVFGIQAEAGWALRRLRQANTELDALRQVEVARASIEERTRLAREVHDGLAQHLWLAKLSAERLRRASNLAEVGAIHADLDQVLNESIAEARETVVALRDSGAADAPLAQTIASFATRFGAQTGLDIRLDLDPIEPTELSPRAAGELLRIAQEALNNIRKHADATSVDIALKREGDRVALTVRDNGIGFDPGAAPRGYGLVSMRERAEVAGGSAAIQSEPSAGTTITVQVPVAAT